MNTQQSLSTIELVPDGGSAIGERVPDHRHTRPTCPHEQDVGKLARLKAPIEAPPVFERARRYQRKGERGTVTRIHTLNKS